jgi:4-hydroxybenzoate polyprenyltransferase
MIAYLKLFRLPFVFTAAADSATGYLLASGTVSPRTLGLLALSSAGLYAFGMAMNDVADREKDRALAPGRPLPSGKVSLRGALSASLFIAGLSAFAVRWLEPKPGLAHSMWAGAFAGILVYDFALKAAPVMGAIRFFNFLLGAAVAGAAFRESWTLALPAFAYGTSLTFVSTLEDGEGRKGLRWLGVAGMSASAVVPAVLGRPWALVPALLLAAWLVKRAAAPPDKKNVMLLVRDGVAGYILLDAVLLASSGRYVEAAVVAALLVPAFALVALFRRLG